MKSPSLLETLFLTLLAACAFSATQAQTVARTDSFFYARQIVQWTVPQGVATLRITAKGAEGTTSFQASIAAGLGASVTGSIDVVPGQVLKILVGEHGTRTDVGSTGGGGSFVTTLNNEPLVIAGGGGGGGNGYDATTKQGQAEQSGGNGSGPFFGLGGLAGNGGGGSVSTNGGGGLLTSGGGGGAGQAFVDGGNGYGTFGGGAVGNIGGGGGGGYSGGGGGGEDILAHIQGVGGGGGSFNKGSNQENIAGANSGNGLVVISYLLPDGDGDGIPDKEDCDPQTFTAAAIQCSAGPGIQTDPSACTGHFSTQFTVTGFVNPTVTARAVMGGGTFTVTQGATSGCTTTYTLAATNLPIGSTVVQLFASDKYHQAQCTFGSYVADANPPVVTCPGNISVTASDASGAVVNYPAATTANFCPDSYKPAATLRYSKPSGSRFPIGTTSVEVTATDYTQAKSTCTFTVTVNCPPVSKSNPDFDKDGVADLCDTDDDNDGIPDAYDCEPLNKKVAKYAVCHGGKSLCVDKAGMQDHVKHGDKLGNCGVAVRNATTVNKMVGEEEGQSFAGRIYPNPTKGQFNLELTHTKAEAAQVLIVNSKGGTIEQRKIALQQGTQTFSFNLSGRASGLYLVQLKTGSGVQAFKVYVQP